MLHGCSYVYSLHKIDDIYVDIAQDVEKHPNFNNSIKIPTVKIGIQTHN